MKPFAQHGLRPAHSISATELAKATNRFNPPDDAGDASRKKMETNDGRAPGAEKTRQQKDGVWCPLCQHHHRPETACASAAKMPVP